ncbi:MucR family transcriptional regulator [Methylobacterium sp. GXS13]|jgi:predicted transcriptional regulator|uniref:MucR family transcriptional regulator n=1 Tax=Methylobacterium sp. GXS13 TaxID=1730094 RepID=UPI00071BEC49|nr:MucR family transcriptional regulator [Methylobacterium sp. GXS13]KST56994.1 MucR family transcriptional regulator [Methylobacterium sp. GXS13]
MKENTKFDYHSDIIGLTADIVAAYISNNSVPVAGLPGLIHSVQRTVSKLTSGGVPETVVIDAEVQRPSPAQIRKSVQQDGIMSFIDSKTYKTLKRHLTANGFSPQSYRERYGLPADYPMVAPNYAEQRSALAKSFGLGQPGVMAGRGRKARKTS